MLHLCRGALKISLFELLITNSIIESLKYLLFGNRTADYHKKVTGEFSERLYVRFTLMIEILLQLWKNITVCVKFVKRIHTESINMFFLRFQSIYLQHILFTVKFWRVWYTNVTLMLKSGNEFFLVVISYTDKTASFI